MAGAVALACVLASATPAAGEPRLTQANFHPQQSAGIIPPPAVSQPPRVGTRGPTSGVVVWSWPSEGEPRRNQPNPGDSRIVPLTLKYGQQPPITSFVVPAELAAIRAMWEPPAPTPPVPLRVTAGAVVVISFVPYTRAPIAGEIAPPLVRRVVTVPLASVDQPAPFTRPAFLGAWLELPPSVRPVAIAALIPAAAFVPSSRAPLAAVADGTFVVPRVTAPIASAAALGWGPSPTRTMFVAEDSARVPALPSVVATLPAVVWIASARPQAPIEWIVPRSIGLRPIAAIIPLVATPLQSTSARWAALPSWPTFTGWPQSRPARLVVAGPSVTVVAYRGVVTSGPRLTGATTCAARLAGTAVTYARESAEDESTQRLVGSDESGPRLIGTITTYPA